MRNERPVSRLPPAVKKQTRPQVLGGGRRGFDSTGSLALAGRLNQLRGVKLVEPGREERAARVETIRRPADRPDHKAVAVHVFFPAQESRRFDGSMSSRDVEPFFFRDSCTGGRAAGRPRALTHLGPRFVPRGGGEPRPAVTIQNRTGMARSLLGGAVESLIAWVCSTS